MKKCALIFAGIANLFSAFNVGAASCIPVDERGNACVSLVSNDSVPRDAGIVVYTLKFQNRCNRSISVRAQKSMHLDPGDDGVSGTGVSAGGVAELSCVDMPGGKKCAGFSGWWAKCDR